MHGYCAWKLTPVSCWVPTSKTKIYELETRGTSVLHGDRHLGQPNGICIPCVVRGQRQRAVCANPWKWFIAHAIMRQHLETEVKFNANVWFARVPTEANIADIPFFFLQHPFLPASKDESDKTSLCLEKSCAKSKRLAAR